MALTRTTTAALAAAAVAVALASCSGATGPESPSVKPTQETSSGYSAVPTSSSSTTTSPTPSVDSPEAIATSRAGAVVRDYYRAGTECMKDPRSTPVTCFDAVAISSELINLRNGLTSAQAAQTRVIGDATIDSMTRARIDLAYKPKETPPTIPVVVFNVCYDVSKVNVVDYQGKSIVPADRKSRAVEEVAVVNYKYPDPSQWRVGYVVPTDKTC